MTAGARPTIIVCGLGPGSPDDVTVGTERLLSGPYPVYFRTFRHPTAGVRGGQGVTSFDQIYDESESLALVYDLIAQRLIEAATEQQTVVYAVPGSPLVLERSVAHLMASSEVEVQLRPAVSFLDAAWAWLGIDPIEAGVRLVDGHTFAVDAAGERGPLLVAHAHAEWVLSDIKLAVDAGPEMKAVVLQGLGTPEERIFEVEWPDLDRAFEADHLTSLYLPEVTAPVGRELQRTVELMHRLRQECPWDQDQDHQSLRRYLIEESYEVLDAIEGLEASEDETVAYLDLEEELGDLWFQILFHAELATEAGQFTIADVARSVHDKLVSRHPHVFGDTAAPDADTVVTNWEAIKKVEKGRESVMDGIPGHLPALSLAEKVLKKANRAGATADSAALDSLLGPAAELVTDAQLGQLLLAVVERARQRGVDAEGALRAAVKQAEASFRDAEQQGSMPVSWVTG